MNNMYLNIYVIFLCNIYQYICMYFIRFDKGGGGDVFNLEYYKLNGEISYIFF